MRAESVYVSYGETVSQNYQSRKAEFGITVTDGTAARIARARKLVTAVVRRSLGLKVGMRRADLDKLTDEFFGGTWDELETGISKEDEEL